MIYAGIGEWVEGFADEVVLRVLSAEERFQIPRHSEYYHLMLPNLEYVLSHATAYLRVGRNPFFLIGNAEIWTPSNLNTFPRHGYWDT
jgi:hypothetical protein